DGQSVVVAASVGVVLAAAGAHPDELLRDADVAMYTAKRAGGGRFRFFEPSMRAAVRERLVLKADLRRALERDEFHLHYQPIVDLATHRVVGLEALVRWAHPERGLLLPGAFVPLAEETGLILPLGRWVLAEGCRQLRAWQASGRADESLIVSVNLSARQFAERGLVEDVTETLAAIGLAPACLQLEVTESIAMGDATGATDTLQELKALGVRLALDDFGTGYSSLGHLRRFPLDTLKIDRGFVAGLGDDVKGDAIVGAMLELGRALGLETVAEGVETKDVLDRLRAHGCEAGQGYLFAKPMAAEEAEALLVSAGPAVV
ncbi:MAG: GGDEF domain-containing phosphodiesterase, partial [Chloroflexota bacterium]|nr:GGDEF domain-containing phosphodiesterase [Chloroflexota bacterium]